jgi:hypothetical protein
MLFHYTRLGRFVSDKRSSLLIYSSVTRWRPPRGPELIDDVTVDEAEVRRHQERQQDLVLRQLVLGRRGSQQPTPGGRGQRARAGTN